MSNLNSVFEMMCQQFSERRRMLCQVSNSIDGPGSRVLKKSVNLLDDDNHEVKRWLDSAKARHVRTENPLIACRSDLDWRQTALQYGEGTKGLNCFFKINLLLAGIDYQWAKEAWDYDNEMALKSLSSALCLLSECYGACSFSWLIEVEKEKLADKVRAAKLGGNRKAAVYIPIRKEAVRLLYKRVPLDVGWKNISKAAEAIEKDLWSFIEKQKKNNEAIDLAQHSLVETIKRWRRNDSELKTAFNETVQKSKKNSALL